MIKTIKVRLKPTLEQENYFGKLQGQHDLFTTGRWIDN